MQLKVSGGFLKGRKIIIPKNINIRPTTSRNREMVFDKISLDIVNSDFLDLFCGYGAMGLEAISRGANSSCFCDINNFLLNNVKENADNFNVNDKCFFQKTDLNKKKTGLFNDILFDVIFADPPYKLFPLNTMYFFLSKLKQNGIFIYEISSTKKMDINFTNFYIIDDKIVGGSRFIFIKRK